MLFPEIALVKITHQSTTELMNGEYSSDYILVLYLSILHSILILILRIRYKKWLPDNVVGRHDTKTTYQVEIRYANNTNETFTFHGPQGISCKSNFCNHSFTYLKTYLRLSFSGAHEVPGPVKWTRPYFDCGRSNKWLVAAVVPIADLYPRHTGFRHIEYPM